MRWHAALDPAGPQAARIAALWWLMFWTCLVVFVIVVAVMVWAVRRARADARARMPAPIVYPGAERMARVPVVIAVGLTLVVLVVFLVASVRTGHGLASLGVDAVDFVDITVIGHQWWWEIVYTDPEPANRVVTANEIHVPVGRPVRITTQSRDVIHSLWLPRLHGKRDLIPGRPAELVIQADRPGRFDGRCAEFCGLQHAHMQLAVIAESPESFEAWRAAQRQPAAPPADDLTRRGQDLFVRGSCALCHTIRGTAAGARTGPDLTHLASRVTLAAGTMPNTVGHLAGWIIDPQHVKPGVTMPSMGLAPEELHPLLAYLGTLR
jgi:cytochrome c oxidase subunit II